MSYKTRFISKEPKQEPKLVLTLSETKRLISVVSQNDKTASFGWPETNNFECETTAITQFYSLLPHFFNFYSIYFSLFRSDLHFLLC